MTIPRPAVHRRHTEDWIRAHEELIRDYMERNPDCSELRAYMRTLPNVDNAYWRREAAKLKGGIIYVG